MIQTEQFVGYVEIAIQSDLSPNSVALALRDDGRLEITLISRSGDESWGERLDADSTRAVVAGLTNWLTEVG